MMHKSNWVWFSPVKWAMPRATPVQGADLFACTTSQSCGVKVIVSWEGYSNMCDYMRVY